MDGQYRPFYCIAVTSSSTPYWQPPKTLIQVTPLEKERRAHPRANAPEIPLTLIGSDHVLRVRDISQSGVAFYSESPVPLMTRVQFQIQLPDSAKDCEQTVAGEGAVVRCERLSPALGHYEIAVFFQHLEKGSLDHLKDYMQRALA